MMNKTKPDQPTDDPRIVRLLQGILALHEAEVDCETCTEQIDCLAELVAVGYEPSKLLPAVQAHLDCCSDCREEYEALVCILRAQQSGKC